MMCLLQGLLRELGTLPVARARLLPALMTLFGRPQLWGPISNFFALLVEGCGELAGWLGQRGFDCWTELKCWLGGEGCLLAFLI
jgi:hypothetical protein